MSTPIVEVKHLSHRYSVDWAIRDINFSIEKTGILGLLGSNGAGKSTTIYEKIRLKPKNILVSYLKSHPSIRT